MWHLLFILILLAKTQLAIAQKTVDELERDTKSLFKRGQLKKIKEGTKANGFAVFFNKADEAIFSVEIRESYQLGQARDSVISFQAHFHNDTLFRIYTSSYSARKKQYFIFYFRNGVIIARKIVGDLMPNDEELLVKKAYLLLNRGKKVINEPQ
jgi:hypothetical protein